MHTMKDHRSYHGEAEIIEPKSGESYERNHRKRGNKPKPDKNETRHQKKATSVKDDPNNQTAYRLIVHSGA